MKAWCLRYWPTLIIASTVAYALAAIAVSFIFAESEWVNIFVAPFSSIFPLGFAWFTVDVLGPAPGLTIILCLAVLLLVLVFALNRRSRRWAVAALALYVAASIWMYLNFWDIQFWATALRRVCSGCGPA